MKALAATIVVATLLAACDTVPNLRLHNGTGRVLDLQIAKGQEPFRAVHLGPGESIRIWNIYGPGLRLNVEGCERRYALPPMELNYPWRLPDDQGGMLDYKHGYPVEVSLEPDFSLSLLSEGSPQPGARPPGDGAPAQSHGFPLQPTPRTCG